MAYFANMTQEQIERLRTALDEILNKIHSVKKPKNGKPSNR